ncbi:hypothetical protein DL95DRAFT_130196 [Leptodontidium sp. 2 PMI_412]|nr:hypothetical protein DL95DRAFT_130196 [Leptodontidium sp. 2 PMI_412]
MITTRLPPLQSGRKTGSHCWAQLLIKHPAKCGMKLFILDFTSPRRGSCASSSSLNVSPDGSTLAKRREHDMSLSSFSFQGGEGEIQKRTTDSVIKNIHLPKKTQYGTDLSRKWPQHRARARFFVLPHWWLYGTTASASLHNSKSWCITHMRKYLFQQLVHLHFSCRTSRLTQTDA